MNKYDEVVSSCDGLIYMIINKYFRGYDREDLHQVGVIGVIKAYKNYKDDKCTKFSTYAYKYIYGEIFAYVNSNKSLRIAREYYPLIKKINEARNVLSQRLMKEPTIFELASFLELDEALISYVLELIKPVDSLDRIICENDKNISLFDTVKDERDYYNIDYLMLNSELEKLPEEEKKIIYLRYFEDKTQSEVAGILGINQVQVSRNEQKTLKRIKKSYENAA